MALLNRLDNNTTTDNYGATQTMTGGYSSQHYCSGCNTWHYGWHQCHSYTPLVIHTETVSEEKLLKAWIDGFMAAGGKLTEAKLKKIVKKLEEYCD